MSDPTEPADVSVAESGDVVDVPEQVTSVVLTNQEDEITGLFERWTDEAWIYAKADALEEF